MKREARIIFSIPGRIRLRLPESPDLDKILEIKGVKEAVFNDITCSLLINYEKSLSEKLLLSEIKKKIPDMKVLPDSGKSWLSQIVLKAAKQTNRKTRAATKGYADISSVIPSLFALLGIEELIRKPGFPHWYDFFWYALNMFYWQSKNEK